MSAKHVKKVAAVVTRLGKDGTELLVFDHPLEDGGVMVQLPGGTIEPDELPDMVAVRELQEETGVSGQIVALEGVRDEEYEGEKRRRWVYLVSAPEGILDEWPFACDCGAPTRCHWILFLQTEIVKPQRPWLEMARAWVRASKWDTT